MASGLLKLATLGGVAASGGGIVAGASMMSGSKQEASAIQKTSASVEEKESLDQSDDSPSLEPKAPVCIIYKADIPVPKTGTSREFKKLLERFENKDGFFSKLQGVENETQIKKDVKEACSGSNGKKNKDGNVYVWQEGNKWIYSTPMNEKDWVKETTVAQEFTSRK
ncbi:hypothetical protein MHF_1119 [Mycoplasma haemofelis Ohio2]|uniref:Uncharacterized protein n=1 Tax=Mycoplasma haemofelis (strain Ohio2) TaxID=859194 RepID=F6FJK7_MYCHI|nr:hypothetical protein MHF_1119 [Mycoplasma haemofelis Ohio2]